MARFSQHFLFLMSWYYFVLLFRLLFPSYAVLIVIILIFSVGLVQCLVCACCVSCFASLGLIRFDCSQLVISSRVSFFYCPLVYLSPVCQCRLILSPSCVVGLLCLSSLFLYSSGQLVSCGSSNKAVFEFAISSQQKACILRWRHKQ